MGVDARPTVPGQSEPQLLIKYPGPYTAKLRNRYPSVLKCDPEYRVRARRGRSMKTPTQTPDSLSVSDTYKCCESKVNRSDNINALINIGGYL